ncbi:MAG: hypothetical protein KAW52_07180 [candidate division Zixibacteria bacterium]|nr:hypothetical protein [candidate division Zixibacteria bacterium]
MSIFIEKDLSFLSHRLRSKTVSDKSNRDYNREVLKIIYLLLDKPFFGI